MLYQDLESGLRERYIFEYSLSSDIYALAATLAQTKYCMVNLGHIENDVVIFKIETGI